MYTENSQILNIFFLVIFCAALLWALIHIPIMSYRLRRANLTQNEKSTYLLKQIKIILCLLLLMLGDIGLKFFLQF